MSVKEEMEFETMTIQEAAGVAGVTSQAIRAWIKDKKVRVIYEGKQGASSVATRVSAEDVRLMALKRKEQLEKQLRSVDVS